MTRKVPATLQALGGRSLPSAINVGTATWTRQKVFKNDFFAVTAMYEGETGRVLLKVGRAAPFLLIPMSWIGRWLASKEQAVLEQLQDLQGIPRFLARWQRGGIIREFVDGRPLAKGEAVPDDFHGRLQDLVTTIHRRGMAYVDLEKCENVLVGDDGLPYLFDFQIAWYVPRRWGGELWPMRKLRGWFQAGDRYHLLKLKRRTRPDQLTDEELAHLRRKPWFIHVQRWLTRPFTVVRRAVLNRIDPRRAGRERGRIEDGPAVQVKTK